MLYTRYVFVCIYAHTYIYSGGIVCACRFLYTFIYLYTCLPDLYNFPSLVMKIMANAIKFTRIL